MRALREEGLIKGKWRHQNQGGEAQIENEIIEFKAAIQPSIIDLRKCFINIGTNKLKCQKKCFSNCDYGCDFGCIAGCQGMCVNTCTAGCQFGCNIGSQWGCPSHCRF